MIPDTLPCVVNAGFGLDQTRTVARRACAIDRAGYPAGLLQPDRRRRLCARRSAINADKTAVLTTKVQIARGARRRGQLEQLPLQSFGVGEQIHRRVLVVVDSRKHRAQRHRRLLKLMHCRLAHPRRDVVHQLPRQHIDCFQAGVEKRTGNDDCWRENQQNEGNREQRTKPQRRLFRRRIGVACDQITHRKQASSGA